MGKVKLLLLGGVVSPYTARARIALHLKGVGYEFVEEAFGPAKSELLLKSNPVYKKIPVLVDGAGRAVCESAVIVHYVDEGWAGVGPAILPDDPYDRAMHRFWTAYIDDKFWPALDAISLAPTAEARAKATDDTRAALQLLERAFKDCSKGKSFFSGADASPGLLDIALGCFLPALKACEQLNGVALLDDAATPLLKGWSERFAGVGAVEAVLPETEKVVEFTRFIRAKLGVGTN